MPPEIHATPPPFQVPPPEPTIVTDRGRFGRWVKTNFGPEKRGGLRRAFSALGQDKAKFCAALTERGWPSMSTSPRAQQRRAELFDELARGDFIQAPEDLKGPQPVREDPAAKFRAMATPAPRMTPMPVPKYKYHSQLDHANSFYRKHDGGGSWPAPCDPRNSAARLGADIFTATF